MFTVLTGSTANPNSRSVLGGARVGSKRGCDQRQKQIEGGASPAAGVFAFRRSWMNEAVSGAESGKKPPSETAAAVRTSPCLFRQQDGRRLGRSGHLTIHLPQSQHLLGTEPVFYGRKNGSAAQETAAFLTPSLTH